MTNISKYDVIVIRFPFASSLGYKARPAVVISSDTYNRDKRDTVLVMAISSSVKNKLEFEPKILKWKEAGLLKESLLKSSVATIEKSSILIKIGSLDSIDIVNLENTIAKIC